MQVVFLKMKVYWKARNNCKKGSNVKFEKLEYTQTYLGKWITILELKLAPSENLNLKNLNKKKLKIHKDTHKSETEKVVKLSLFVNMDC